MARKAGVRKEEVEAIIGKYKQSGLTRQEYCKREGMTVYMLDYYHRRLYKLREREAAKSRAVPVESGSVQPQTRIARVEVRKENATVASPVQGFAMTLANGRRIEVAGWGYRDSDLTRLIQVAERA
jgi:hypothetical protein